MADTTFSSYIVTDPHTLLSTSRAIWERVPSRANSVGLNAVDLIKQLRLLFIDSRQALFVFGAPDKSTLNLVKLYARQALERALKDIFEEKVRIELVVFTQGESSLSDLIARFSDGQEKESILVETAPLQRKTAPLADPSEDEAGERQLNKVQLALLQSSLRGVFTSPKRVVVVPGYLLRWIPYIGPLRTSIVVACFQAFYLCRGSTAKADLTFEAPGPLLAAVAGIAESSIWRHLDDPHLGWFLKKAPYHPGEKRWIRDEKAGITRKRPTRFLFRSTTPLTPGDAQALFAYLTDLNIQEDPIDVLKQLVSGEYPIEPRDVFPFPSPPPPDDWLEGSPEGCLIHNVIYAALGMNARSAPKVLADLVDELVERLLPANDQLHISWYFLLHWQPLLGHGPGWATLLLRDRCFYNRQTGELRDTVSLRGGYRELAQALGLQRIKTAREWFPPPHAQKEAVKNADLSSQEALASISQSKRCFVREYAARFADVVEADADGRGQVSAFKARVKLFDPLTPAHEALYTAIYPLVQRYFTLLPDQRAAFLGAYERVLTMDQSVVRELVQDSKTAAEAILQAYEFSIQPGESCTLGKSSAADVLGAIERITIGYVGAIEKITPADSGAIESISAVDSVEFGRITALLSGAIEKITSGDMGAIEGIGLVFWAWMRGLKYLVLNNPLEKTLRDYLKNTDLENTEKSNSTTTLENASLNLGDNGGVVNVAGETVITHWDINRLLNNFSPHVKHSLLEKSITAEAMVSCLLYIASSKGDNLGLGYVVEKLRGQPQEGQDGIYRRLAAEPPEEIISRLQTYLEYRSFNNRDWRVAMGTPSSEKIVELLEHLGLDSSKFGNAEEWG